MPGDPDPDDGWVTTFTVPSGSEYQHLSYSIDTEGPASGVVIELVLPGDLGATAWVDEMVVYAQGVTTGYPCYTLGPTDGPSLTQVKELLR